MAPQPAEEPAQQEHRHHRPDPVAAAGQGDGVDRVHDVLDDLEAEPDEGAVDEPVHHAVDLPPGDEHDHRDTEHLDRFLDGRAGQRRSPGAREARGHQLGEQVVGGRVGAYRGGGGDQPAPAEGGQDQRRRLPLEVVEAARDEDERHRVEREQADGEGGGQRVRRDADPDHGHHLPAAHDEQQHQQPEGGQRQRAVGAHPGRRGADRGRGAVRVHGIASLRSTMRSRGTEPMIRSLRSLMAAGTPGSRCCRSGPAGSSAAPGPRRRG